jgi:hypothetical protein
VYRLQVPATPDPRDDTVDERARAAVLALLPERAAGTGSRSPDEPTPRGR